MVGNIRLCEEWRRIEPMLIITIQRFSGFKSLALVLSILQEITWSISSHLRCTYFESKSLTDARWSGQYTNWFYFYNERLILPFSKWVLEKIERKIHFECFYLCCMMLDARLLTMLVICFAIFVRRMSFT